MTEQEPLLHFGTCWPLGGRRESGDTTVTRYPGEDSGPVTIFDCTSLNRGVCRVTEKSCELLPAFISPDGVVSCDTAGGRLILDSDSGEFIGPYTSGTLSRADSKILNRLMQTPGEVCMSEDLYRALNPEVNLSNFTPASMDNSVTVRISMLRKALGDEITRPGRTRKKPPHIETIPSVGYRLVANRRRIR